VLALRHATFARLDAHNRLLCARGDVLTECAPPPRPGTGGSLGASTARVAAELRAWERGLRELLTRIARLHDASALLLATQALPLVRCPPGRFRALDVPEADLELLALVLLAEELERMLVRRLARRLLLLIELLAQLFHLLLEAEDLIRAGDLIEAVKKGRALEGRRLLLLNVTGPGRGALG
jgi:hypothetical protein